MNEKKAQAIIKVFSDMQFSSGEWEMVGFHVYDNARQGVLDNITYFYNGLQYFINSPHFGNVPQQLEFDFGGLR